MNWYKKAEETTVTVTSAEFRAMTWKEKMALAGNTSISHQTQQLFFTQKYERKCYVLRALVRNTSISQQTQQLFLTQEYEGKGDVLWCLAKNSNIAPETQRLFFTEPYERKNHVLANLTGNPIFLQNLTTAQWLQIKNAARGGMRLLVLSKRLKQIAGVS